MSNFRQKLHETLYLSVNGSAGVRRIMLVYTSLACDIFFFFSFLFQLCSQQMVIIMFAQINEYLKKRQDKKYKKCPSTQ